MSAAVSLPGLAPTEPTLVYRSDHAEVWHGDALDVLRPLPMGTTADLVIADPPYGQEWRSGRRAESFGVLHGDSPAGRGDVRDVLAASLRVTRRWRHIYVFGPADILDDLKVSARTELIWDKGIKGTGDLTAPWGPQHERITFAVGMHRSGSRVGANNLPVRLRKGSVLHVARPNGSAVRHPSEKPVALLRELIESSSRAGELVLDPFAGIGSTGVAAVLLGRRALLIEIDRGYCDVAVDRIRQAEALAERAVGL